MRFASTTSAAATSAHCGEIEKRRENSTVSSSGIERHIFVRGVNVRRRQSADADSVRARRDAAASARIPEPAVSDIRSTDWLAGLKRSEGARRYSRVVAYDGRCRFRWRVG